MKTKLQTDSEIFNEAIKFAKKRGYTVPPLEWAVLVKGSREMGMNSSMRMWALGLVYSQPFLKAFFGEQLIRRKEDNELLYAIGIWAKQVAYEFEGQVYAAREGYNEMVFPKYDNAEFWAEKAPAEVIEAQHVVMKLKDMACTIPVRTHKIKSIEVKDITPEIPMYKYCLAQMVEYDNPFLYLKRFMETIR